MSNVIKAYSVRYENVDRITLNHYPSSDKSPEPEYEVIQVGKEPEGGEFVQGLEAVKVEELEPKEELTREAEKIIEAANTQAAELIEAAAEEADKIKSDAFQEAQQKGYEEGKQKAEQEALELKSDYEEKHRKLQKEYDDMALSFEPRMAGLIALLVEKITGIMIRDNEEVIIYLIQKALTNLDKGNAYTIRVSTDDYDRVSGNKTILMETIGREASLTIAEDVQLMKNQCMIETEFKVINCSLDVQLNNLITDLKLLGGV